MGSAEQLIDANALGTLYVNDAFLDVLEPGGCVVDVSSRSAHMVPGIALPRWSYPVARTDVHAFRRRVLRWINLFPWPCRPNTQSDLKSPLRTSLMFFVFEVNV